MPELKRTGLIVVSAVFTAVGIGILIVDPDVTGAIIVLFFGSCLLVFIAPAVERSTPRTRRAVISHRGERSEALVFPLARSRLRIFGIAGGLWAICGALMAAYPESLADPGESTAFVRLLGVALVVMFGTIVLLAVLQERRGGFVALLPSGILSRAGVGETFVPWDAIESVGIVSMYDTPMVGVEAKDPSLVESARWTRVFSRANRAMMGADVFYANLSVPLEELASAIADRLDDPDKRRQLGEP